MLTDVYYFICPCGNNNDLENEEGDDNNNNNNNTTLNVIMTFIIVTLSTSLALNSSSNPTCVSCSFIGFTSSAGYIDLI